MNRKSYEAQVVAKQGSDLYEVTTGPPSKKMKVYLTKKQIYEGKDFIKSVSNHRTCKKNNKAEFEVTWGLQNKTEWYKLKSLKQMFLGDPPDEILKYALDNQTLLCSNEMKWIKDYLGESPWVWLFIV